MVGSVQGVYYAAGSSRSVAAELSLHPAESLEVVFSERSEFFEKGKYRLEPPLGRLTRVVHFPSAEGDGRFETDDFEGFGVLESQLTSSGRWKYVALLENHWKGTLLSVALLVFFAYAFLAWGLPLIARKVADDMPQSWRVSMTQQSVDLMEKIGYMGPSELDAAEGERVEGIFAKALRLSSATVDRYDYEFRLVAGDGVGANAFAFPSGLVVATDEFVALCETDEQILAVFLHEIAHVEEQHGIRALIQRGGVFLVLSIVTGDANSVISLAEGIPALVLNSQYSQRFELQCDTFSAVVLEEAGIGAESMKEILIRLHMDSPDIPIATYLSSHPSMRARVENIEAVIAGGRP